MFFKRKRNPEEYSDSKSLMISVMASQCLLFADKFYQFLFPLDNGEISVKSNSFIHMILSFCLIILFYGLYHFLFYVHSKKHPTKNTDPYAKAQHGSDKSCQTITERLTLLKKLKDDGTITETEYHKRRKEIILEI